MPERETLNQASGWMQLWLPAITAAWGGLVGYVRQVQSGRAFNAFAMIVHLAVAGFAGLMFWLLAIEYNLSGPLTAVVTGIAGAMGTEAIKILEERVKANAGRIKG